MNAQPCAEVPPPLPPLPSPPPRYAPKLTLVTKDGTWL